MAETSILQNKKIVVEPNIRPTAFIQDTNHKASFLAPSAKNRYPLPIDKKTGKYKQVLTEKEQKELEGIFKRSLSVYERNDNFWDGFEVLLSKLPKTLNLKDPSDFIAYKILKAYPRIIAESKDKLKDKLTYKYYFKDEEAEALVDAEKTDYEEKVWELFGQIKKDRVKMMNFFKITGKNVSSSTTDAFMISKIKDTYIKGSEENMKFFYDTLNNSNFETRVLISKCIENRSLVKEGSKYYLQEGDELASTYDQLVRYLESDKNQNIRVLLEERVNI